MDKFTKPALHFKPSSAPQSKLCISKQPHKIALLYTFLLIYLSTIKVGSDQIKCMPCIIAAIIVLGCILHSMHLSYQCYTPCVGQFEDLTKLSIGAVGCHCQNDLHRQDVVFLINQFVTHKSRSLFGMWT